MHLDLTYKRVALQYEAIDDWTAHIQSRHSAPPDQSTA